MFRCSYIWKLVLGSKHLIFIGARSIFLSHLFILRSFYSSIQCAKDSHFLILLGHYFFFVSILGNLKGNSDSTCNSRRAHTASLFAIIEINELWKQQSRLIIEVILPSQRKRSLDKNNFKKSPTVQFLVW